MTIMVEGEVFASLSDKVNKIHDHVKHSGKPKPVRKPVGGSVTIPAGFTAPVLLTTENFPTVGRVWNILKVAIFAADPHTAVANVTADIYAGTNPDPAVPSLTDAIASLAVPTIQYFPKEVEWCYPGQQPFALLYGSGLVAGASYSLVLRVAEFNAVDVEARHIP